MNIYIIRNENDPELYWNNAYGWVELSGDITVFTEGLILDADGLISDVSLPMEGKWVKFSEK